MSELPLVTREHLEKLLGKHPSELAIGDLQFLHARREYMTENQREYFEIGEESPLDPNAQTKEPQEFLSKKDAMKKLKELGVEFDEKESRLELNNRIVEALDADEDEE